MRNAVPIVLIALVAVGVAAFVLVPTDDTPLPEERPISALDLPLAEHPPGDRAHGDEAHGEPGHTHEASGERRGPNGMPIPDDAPVKEAAALEREAHAPLGDAEAWVGERAEAHQDWIEATAAAMDIYATREQLDPQTSAAMQSVIAALQAEVGATRRAIEQGELNPITGRQDITAARETAEAELTEILGVEEANNFRLEMMKRVPGGVI